MSLRMQSKHNDDLFIELTLNLTVETSFLWYLPSYVASFKVLSYVSLVALSYSYNALSSTILSVITFISILE